MEKIQRLLTTDEQILWTGHPDATSLNSDYLTFRILGPIILLALNGIFGFFMFGTWNSLVFTIIWLCIMIILDVIFLLGFLSLRKNPTHGNLLFILTNKRLLIQLVKKFKVNEETIDALEVCDYPLPRPIFSIEDNLLYINLDNIIKIQLKPNTGIREAIGYKGFNIELNFNADEDIEIYLPQLPPDQISKLIMALTEHLSFNRVFTSLFETYIPEKVLSSI